MTRSFRRTRQTGWVFAALAAIFGLFSLGIVVAIAHVDPGELPYPSLLPLWGLPLAASAGLCVLSARHLRHQPVLMQFGPEGVTVGARPELAWSEIAAIVHRAIVFSYGPRDQIVLRRHVPPSGIAAQRAERAVSALFTDVSIVPSLIDSSVEEILTELDAGLATAGFRRAETPTRRFRGFHISKTWPVLPVSP